MIERLSYWLLLSIYKLKIRNEYSAVLEEKKKQNFENGLKKSVNVFDSLSLGNEEDEIYREIITVNDLTVKISFRWRHYYDATFIESYLESFTKAQPKVYQGPIKTVINYF